MTKRKLPMIAYGKLKDTEKLLQWLKDYGWRRRHISHFNSINDGGWYNEHWQDYFYKRQDIFSGNQVKNIFEDDPVWDNEKHPMTERFFLMLDYLQSVNQQLEIYYHDEMACLVGYDEIRYVMPSEYFEILPLTDYNQLFSGELHLLLESDSQYTLPALPNDASKAQLAEAISQKQDNLSKLQQEKDNIRNGETAGLKELQTQIEVLQAEMNKKKQELMEQLEAKMKEFTQQKTLLEQQLFLLETQIYGIRCYLGEVVKFHKIREGRPGDINTPIVVYQKIRYLDEELGKAVSLYGFGSYEDDTKQFLSLLKNRDDMRDIFVPEEKSVALIKVSRSDTVKHTSGAVANALEDYEIYHAKQLAVLVRNGEELYISWLDKDKISLSDENAFYSTKKRNTEYEYDEKNIKTKSSAKEEVVSRFFILSILQGITDHGIIIQIPEKIHILSKNQRYVILSMADGYLADYTYGYFSDILDRFGKIPMKEGDQVLTLLKISRDDYHSKDAQLTYNNDRGIGERNRTHDAIISPYQVIPVNKVLFDLVIEWEYEKIQCVLKTNEIPHDHGFTISTTSVVETEKMLGYESDSIRIYAESISDRISRDFISSKLTDEDIQKMCEYTISGSCYYINQNGRECLYRHSPKEANEIIFKKRFIKVTAVRKIYHYYLSAEKEYGRYRDSNARANLEIEPDEIIPLTFLCPTWLQYVITTKNIGRWRVGNTDLSYADSLKYLNICLQYLNKRREEEKVAMVEAGLKNWIDEHADWDVLVTEWRIENRIRKLTPFQAKRFARTLS